MRRSSYNGVIKRATIFGHLSPETVETIAQRFEADFQANKIPIVLKNGRNCTVCASEYRVQINRKLLEGDFFLHIGKDYGVHPDYVGRHYEDHLIPVVEPEMKASLLDLAKRVIAYIPFPLNGAEDRQIRWCLNQYLLARSLLLDDVASPAKSELKCKSLMFYVTVIGKIRDTAVLLHKVKSKRQEHDDLEDLVSEQQQKVLEDARKRRKITEGENDGEKGRSVGENLGEQGTSATGSPGAEERDTTVGA